MRILRLAWKTSRIQMSDSDQTALTHDFEVLLRYAAGEKVMLTPKQRFIPVRHVRNMMENFR